MKYQCRTIYILLSLLPIHAIMLDAVFANVAAAGSPETWVYWYWNADNLGGGAQ